MATSLGLDLQINKSRRRRGSSSSGVPPITVTGFTTYRLEQFSDRSLRYQIVRSPDGSASRLPAAWFEHNTEYGINSQIIGFHNNVNFITFRFGNVIEESDGTLIALSMTGIEFESDLLDRLVFQYTTNTAKTVTISLADREQPRNPLLPTTVEGYTFTMNNSMIDEFLQSLTSQDTRMSLVASLI